MKISDFKNEAIQKGQSIFSDIEIRGSVHIGNTIYSFTQKADEYKFKRLNHQSVLFNHVFILFETNMSRYKRFNENERNCLLGQLNLMKEYWMNYCQLKGYEGVIFIGDTSNDEFKEIFQEVTNFHQLEDNYRALIGDLTYQIVTQTNSKKILGACIDQALLNHLDKFLSSIQIICEVLSENKLLVSSGKHKFNLYENFNNFYYCGEKLSIRFLNDFQSILIRRYEEDKYEIKSEMEVPADGISFRRALSVIKEENELKNLVQPPSRNFKSFLKRIEIFCHEAMIEREFDKMIQYFGSWEEAEEISAHLMNALNNKEIEELLDVSNKKGSGKELKIHRIYHNGMYFFLLRSIYEQKGDSFLDVQMQYYSEKYPSQIKEIVGEFLTNHMRD